MSFNKSLSFGKVGETQIAEWLRSACRYHVLPVYELDAQVGKGPVFFPQSGGALIAPDLLAFRKEQTGDVRVRWIEAKTKSAFTWHRKTQQWVTGIDLRHYQDYLTISSLSPFPVWLLFLHLSGVAKDTPLGMTSPTGLFAGELSALRTNEHHRHENWGKSGMVYWAHTTLTRLATLEQVNT